ncbi:MAG: DMT family transporter [Pseudomonadota bacterium]
MSYEWAALGAALCWALSSLLAADVSREIGGMAFTRLRVWLGFAMLLCITIPNGRLAGVPLEDYGLLALSGCIGLALGDGALFVAFKRLGPRRAQILYTSNAPIAVVLGVLFLGERPSFLTLSGIAAVIVGVVIAVIWGKRLSQIHQWEQIQGSLLVGCMFGLLSGLGQALGTLIVKPVLDDGVDPIAASTVRMGAAALMLYMCRHITEKESGGAKITKTHVLFAAGNSFLAVVVGVSLLLFAFAHGDIGVASALSATTPVLVLPLIWLQTKERPAMGAWGGAILAVAGIILIVNF